MQTLIVCVLLVHGLTQEIAVSSIQTQVGYSITLKDTEGNTYVVKTDDKLECRTL